MWSIASRCLAPQERQWTCFPRGLDYFKVNSRKTSFSIWVWVIYLSGKNKLTFFFSGVITYMSQWILYQEKPRPRRFSLISQERMDHLENLWKTSNKKQMTEFMIVSLSLSQNWWRVGRRWNPVHTDTIYKVLIF